MTFQSFTTGTLSIRLMALWAVLAVLYDQSDEIVGHARNKICYKLLFGYYGGRILMGSFKLGGNDLLEWILEN